MHRVSSILQLSRTIQSAVLVVAYAMALVLELEEQAIKLGQFSTVGNEALHGRNRNVGETLLLMIGLRKHLICGPQLHGKLLLHKSLLLEDITLSNIHQLQQDTFVGDFRQRLSVISRPDLEKGMCWSVVLILDTTIRHVHVPKSVRFLKLLSSSDDQALCARVLLVSHGCLLDKVHDIDLVSQITVVGALSISEVTEDVQLNLVTKLLLHMLLHTPKHERLKNHMETLELILVEFGVTLRVRLNILREPFAELVVRIE
ncbi:hypothetical protein HG530_000229 [Fusarium avenaceum]|nr:hypothetical protein HG530_000229 [Fusarium avenaceum]